MRGEEDGAAGCWRDGDKIVSLRSPTRLALSLARTSKVSAPSESSFLEAVHRWRR